MVIVAVLILLGALVAVAVSFGMRHLGCGLSQYSCNRTEGYAPFVIALAGLVPALGMLVASARTRGRPLRWFVAVAFVYFWWGIVFAGEFG